jgi:tRNA nucleotidyltransferase (CCA-adding enzyme)
MQKVNGGKSTFSATVASVFPVVPTGHVTGVIYLLSLISTKLLQQHLVHKSSLTFEQYFTMENENGGSTKRKGFEMEGIEERLSAAERELFTTLRKVSSGCVIRVVGGWVRDTLLQVSSSDIDLTVEGQSLKEFTDNLKRVCTAHVRIINSNPQQHKFLDTATISLLGFKIEVCEVKSPEADAKRRDLTINSLFYNINERKIEDLTEKGIIDLQEKTLRTPIDAMITLSDDPLRCLRIIRFAAKYEFTIHEEVKNAMHNQSILSALSTSVHRTRMQIELWKILSGSFIH